MNSIKTIDPRQISRLILWLSLMFLLHACATSGGKARTYQEGNAALAQEGGRLSLFLNLKDLKGPHVWMRIKSIEALSGGIWYPVTTTPIDVGASAIRMGQMFLARSFMPPGYYSRIRFSLEKAYLEGGEAGKPFFLSLDTPVVDVSLVNAIRVEKGDSQSLFFTWDTGASLVNKAYFRPVIRVAPKLKHLVADLAYVACPDIDTVYVIRTDKNWVYDSFGIMGNPIYLVKDPLVPQERLYVLTAKDSGIKLISPSANRLVATYHIPLTNRPVFMAIGPHGRWGYIIDRQGGYLVRMDMRSGNLEARVRLGYEPGYIVYLKKYDLLAVSLALSQSVVLLDPVSLSQVYTIPTGNRPEGLLGLGDTLYVAERGSNSVLVFDLENHLVKRRISVGFSPRRLLYMDNLIYVSNYGSASVSVLQPGQLGVARSIHVSGRPFEMASAPNNNWIYVGDEKDKEITVLDPTSNKVAGHIVFGAKPLGMAVIR